MKIDAKKLSDALASVGRVAGRRQLNPILNSVLIETDRGQMSIRGYDCEADIIERLEADGDSIGSFCVPVGILLSFIRCASGVVELRHSGGRLHAACDGSGVSIGTLEAKEFPESVAVLSGGIGVNTSDLAGAIDSVSWAASANDGEPRFETVHIAAKPTEILVESTDKRRLAQVYLSAISVEFEILIPAPRAKLFSSFLSVKDSILNLSDRAATVIAGSSTLTLRLSDHTYPNTKVLTDGKRDKIGTIKRDEVLSVSGLVSGFLDDNSKFCVFTFERDALTVDFKSGKLDYSSKVTGKFGATAFGIDPIFVSDALKAFKEPDIELQNAPTLLVMKSPTLSVYTAKFSDKAVEALRKK